MQHEKCFTDCVILRRAVMEKFQQRSPKPTRPVRRLKLNFRLSRFVLLLLALLVSSEGARIKDRKSDNFKAALRFLKENDKVQLVMMNKMSIANWNFETSLTDESKKEMLKVTSEIARFNRETMKNASAFAWEKFKDLHPKVYRLFKSLSQLDSSSLPHDNRASTITPDSLVAEMQNVYSKAKICRRELPTDCTLALEPDLENLFKSSRNNEELKYYWTKWRDATGRKLKGKYKQFVKLVNNAAKSNGFQDGGAMWRDGFESDTFERDVESLMGQLLPFYKLLHSYVRYCLQKSYPNAGIKNDGPIPAHLLGNMWSQDWQSLIDFVLPYPRKKPSNVTHNMIRKGMTPESMFKLSEEFFVSLGLSPMTPEFWRRSIIRKPEDRDIVCHASAWDFYDGKDFRIKMCTQVNLEHLTVIHHEMGHIQYYQQYAHQPAKFRTSANQGFHEAIGDVIALSLKTVDHLKKVDLIPQDMNSDDRETDINTLMLTALSKVAIIPFSYLVDVYRWELFEGKVHPCSYNRRWWELRLKYQGICPPVKRTEADFDAACKFHVVAGTPYISYFVSHIVQFQFHKALCDESGYKGPLHRCDIYQSKKAGKLLSDTLKLGSSVHWRKAMSIITRGKTIRMSTQPFLEYFKPLIEWLKQETEKLSPGWSSGDPTICPESFSPPHFQMNTSIRKNRC